MDINKLCPYCMTEVDKEGNTTCPHCGCDFSEALKVHHQLKPYTILAGKYLVGGVLEEEEFGITYIGLDLNLEIRVAIKEFYPNGYATREAQSTNAMTVYTGKNMDAVYEWRDNFLKEARSLAKCSHMSGVVGVKDFFQENNTAYVVQEYLEGKTLKENSKARGGKLLVLLCCVIVVIVAMILLIGKDTNQEVAEMEPGQGIEQNAKIETNETNAVIETEEAATKEEEIEEAEPQYYLAKTTEYNDGVLSSVTEYDNVGNQVSNISYNGDGSVRNRWVYEYDSAGNQVSIITYNGDGSVSGRQEYEYDSTGNQVSYVSYSEDGSVSSRWENEYDSTGNRVKYIAYSGDISELEEREYDANGNLVKKEIHLYDEYGEKYDFVETIYEYKTTEESLSLSEEDQAIHHYELVYSSFLSGDRTLLEDEVYADFQDENMEYEFTYIDLDKDGIVELLVQMVDDPCNYNAVFHYEDGKILCWNEDALEVTCRDYPLNDGTMVTQYEYAGVCSYTIFCYQTNGEKEIISKLVAYEEAVYENNSEPCPYYEIDGQRVDRNIFEEKIAELVTGKILERSSWTLIE